MESEIILYVVFAVIWIIYLWEQFLWYRQFKVYKSTSQVPVELESILDDSTFQKARLYQLDRSKFNFWMTLYSQLETTAILMTFAISLLWSWCGGIIKDFGFQKDHEIKVTVVFAFFGSLFSTLLDLPWTVYDTFVIEERHGFNKQTPLSFTKDRLKKFAVMQVITLPIIATLVFIIQIGGDYFFIYLWVFSIVVSLFLITIYPEYIAPLFDNYMPLPEGELRTKIEALAASINFPLTKLYVVEGSKRSSHSNAYFYGFFKNKRIVLFDTLLEDFTPPEQEGKKTEGSNSPSTPDASESAEQTVPKRKKGCNHDEVLAVLAHELGHWKFNHVFKNLFITMVNLFLCFMVFGLLYKNDHLYRAFGFTDSKPVFIGLLVIFQFIFSPYNELLGFCMKVLNRQFEFQADAFAKSLGRAIQLKSALIKLNVDNLSFPVYDWLYSTWYHSHPSLLERLKALDKVD